MNDTINELLTSRYRDDMIINHNEKESIKEILKTLVNLKKKNIKFSFLF